VWGEDDVVGVVEELAPSIVEFTNRLHAVCPDPLGETIPIPDLRTMWAACNVTFEDFRSLPEVIIFIAANV
jgi:hypothetical protein